MVYLDFGMWYVCSVQYSDHMYLFAFMSSAIQTNMYGDKLLLCVICMHAYVYTFDVMETIT